MIRTEEQLRVVREQLSRAEAALEALRRDVLPKNERMYHVMAESYVDVIIDLRTQVEAYLGIHVLPETADLEIALEGDNVALGTTSAALVTRFIDTFRRGIQSAVEIVESATRLGTSRRRERWIENICDLPIVGLARGSVRVLLAEPPDQSLFSAENRQSLQQAFDLIFDGLHWADMDGAESPNQRFSQLSVETRQAMLAVVTQLLPPQSGAVQRVRFHRRGVPGTDRYRETATLSRRSRERIRSELEAMIATSGFREVTGVIRKLDLDDRSFTLRERPDGESDLRCEYGPELEDAVKEFLDNRVIVTGTLEVNRKQKEKLLADSIEPANENSSPGEEEDA